MLGNIATAPDWYIKKYAELLKDNTVENLKNKSVDDVFSDLFNI